jgi:hypothetical protein
MILETFVQQEDFKYVRALGSMYIRMTGRPVQIYESLEPLYRDYRKLRVWDSLSQEWSILHMDEWIHQLLRETHVLGIALPRLPNRRTLQDAAYLPEGPRPTALQDLLMQYGGPMEYFRHKVYVEKSEPAVRAWNARNARLGINDKQDETLPTPLSENSEAVDEKKRTKKKKKTTEDKYNSLFKKSSHPSLPISETSRTDNVKDDAYWDEERAKLGLKPLK